MKIYPQVIVVVLTVNSASANEPARDRGDDSIVSVASATLDLPEAPTIAVNDANVLAGELLHRDATPAATQPPLNAADAVTLDEIHNVPNEEINELISTLIRNAGNSAPSR